MTTETAWHKIRTALTAAARAAADAVNAAKPGTPAHYRACVRARAAYDALAQCPDEPGINHDLAAHFGTVAAGVLASIRAQPNG